ncbi:MAG: hypothetical protein OIN86_04670 [Candidatus Methanoperedens sp.]|nr:hypothetical protein [Candidatus Methanoperedens sp.]CAG0996752.1 hypothetical protein METP1_02617 [Methanosarcinales archaeon]
MTVSITEFSKFHNLLTAQRKDYNPYYIKLEKGGKNPYYNKLDKSCKNHWKSQHSNEGHTYKDALSWMAEGFNVGIVATDRDPLVIIDIDNLEKITDIKPTLRTRSRKRAGLHNFYFGDDKDTKVIIPTGGNGEVRSKWAYVVTAGSSIDVDFNKNPKDKELYDSLPPEQQAQFGLYTVDNELPVSDITFDEFPVEFKERYKKEKDSKNRSKMPDAEYEKFVKEHTENPNQSAIYKLKIENIIGHHDPSERFHSPLHDSSTDANSSVSEGVHHCWRHYVAHSPLQLLGVLAGVLQCEDAGKGHNGRSESQLNLQDGETLYRIWEYAKKEGMIPIDDKPPGQAIVWFATHEGICHITDVKFGWMLGANYYKAMKELKARKLIGGLCSNCFKTKPIEGKTLCQECLDYMNQEKNNGSNKQSKYKSTSHVEDGCIGITKFKKELDEDNVSITVPYFDALTNYYFEYIRVVNSIDYETKKNKTEFESKIVIGDKKIIFDIDVPTSSKNELFEIAIKNACGSDAKFEPRDVSTIRGAFINLMESSKIQKIDKVPMGWHGEEYVMKSVIITKDGIKKNDKYLMDVPETSKARFIDMFEITNEEFVECGKHINKDFMNLHDRYFIQMSLADCYGAPFQRRLEERNVDEMKYPKIDRGESGGGKSFVEKRMQGHFGIMGENGIVTWQSTPKSVDKEGGEYRDVLFLADDILPSTLENKYDKHTFFDILHNYVSASGRTKLTQKSDLNPGKPIGGSLVITAEVTVTEGAGNVGRVCYVDVPKEKDEVILTQRKILGSICLSKEHLYPGFMARYIADVIKNEKWLDVYRLAYIETRNEFLKTNGDDRSAKMHAIRYVHFEMFCNFMVKNGFMSDVEKADNLSFLKEKMIERIKETSSSIQDERPIEIFLDKVQQLVSTGKLTRAQKHECIDDAHTKNPVCIVLDDIDYPSLAFIIPDITLECIKENMRKSERLFNISQVDISRALNEKGLLKMTSKGRNTYQITFNGVKVNTWCIARELIGIPDATNQESLFEVARVAYKSFEKYGIINEPPTPKQYNLVLVNLINQFRPGIGKNDKIKAWKELDKYIRFGFDWKGWIMQELKLEDINVDVNENQIVSEMKQNQTPLICPEIDKLNDLSTSPLIKLKDI